MGNPKKNLIKESGIFRCSRWSDSKMIDIWFCFADSPLLFEFLFKLLLCGKEVISPGQYRFFGFGMLAKI